MRLHLSQRWDEGDENDDEFWASATLICPDLYLFRLTQQWYQDHSAIGLGCPCYSFTINARLIRVSPRTKSGAQPATADPGRPWFPPGGVTPPGPEK